MNSNISILRLPAVKQRVGLGRSSIYSLISKGQFPAQVTLTADGRAVGWLESEIDEFLTKRIEASRFNAKPARGSQQ